MALILRKVGLTSAKMLVCWNRASIKAHPCCVMVTPTSKSQVTSTPKQKAHFGTGEARSMSLPESLEHKCGSKPPKDIRKNATWDDNQNFERVVYGPRLAIDTPLRRAWNHIPWRNNFGMIRVWSSIHMIRIDNWDIMHIWWSRAFKVGHPTTYLDAVFDFLVVFVLAVTFLLVLLGGADDPSFLEVEAGTVSESFFLSLRDFWISFSLSQPVKPAVLADPLRLKQWIDIEKLLLCLINHVGTKHYPVHQSSTISTHSQVS